MLACIAIQIPLRWGDSGYAQLDVLGQQLDAQLQRNKALEARNNAMQAEIDDLRGGTEALEERARTQLNLLGNDEYLIQLVSDKELEN
ncbi:MAG: septum formation initiator family protein [Alcaligenaceae bacterium]|nr:septum formation initiator family protein [Alcaligenaceae bacterium]